MYWFTGILGVLLLIAPFLLGYQTNAVATWTSVVIGFLVGATSFMEGMRHDKENWEYWVAGVLGILAVLSPAIFNTRGVALWATMSLGLLILAVAISRILVGSSRR